LLDAFEIVDDVLRQAVQGISELITVPGLINVDFADVRAIMSNRGSALMGIGRGSGENRAVDAAKGAIASPLLEISIDGAKGILFTLTGGSNLGMYEVSEAAKVITQSADPQAKVIFGAIIDEALKDEVKVTVIATGFDIRPAGSKQKIALSSGTFPVREPLDQISFAGRYAQAAQSANRQPEPQSASSQPAEQQKPQRQPEPAPAAHQPHVQIPTYAPVQQVRPQPAPSPRIPANAEEDELEIPAFIRKKMM